MIDKCSGFRSKICDGGWTQRTSIFILGNHNCGLHSSGILRKHTVNSCGYQRKRQRSERLEILRCRWLAPQAIPGQEKLMVNEIKHFHSCEPQCLIINDLGEIGVVHQELLNLNRRLSLRAQIQLVTLNNSVRCPICQLSSNGTYLRFQLCIIGGIVNIVNLTEQHETEPETYSLSCMQIDYE